MHIRKRGRPRKPRPLFSDPEAERQRVEQCYKEGREPYPCIKMERGAAEKDLLRDVEPGVPFSLIIRANDTDVDGLPLDDPKVDAEMEVARAKREDAARKGGFARKKVNLAATIVAENADFFRAKRAQGALRSAAIRWVNARRTKDGLKCAGRTEMYEALKASGLWA